MREELGFKVQKKSRVTKFLQKVVNKFDSLGPKKLSPTPKKALQELSANKMWKYIDKAKETGSKLELSPFGKRSRGIYAAKKKIAKKEELKESPYDYSPNVTVLSRTKHLAAKDHSCGVCKGTVKKGEVHHRIVYKDHSTKTFKCHRYHGNCQIKENAPTNSMGASSFASGPIHTFDPMLRTKMLKRVKKIIKDAVKR